MKKFYLLIAILLIVPATAQAQLSVFKYIQGGTGTTTAPKGQLIYGGATSYQSVPTTTVSCTGSATCNQFTVLGSSPFTISVSGGSSTGLGSSTSTAPFIASWFVATSTTASTLTSLILNNNLTFNGVTGATWASFCTTITGSADLCDGSDASGSGGSSAYEIATTSDIGVSELSYFSKTGGRTTLASSATSTLSVSGPFIVPSNIRVLGTSGAIVYTGLATSSQPASSNLLVSNGGSNVYGVATSSATCTGSVSCSAFTVVGSVAPTITSSALTSVDISANTNLAGTWPIILTNDTLSFGGLSTSTAPTLGHLPYWSGVNTFSSIATGTVSGTNGITVTAGRSAVGGALAIDCTVASGSAAGCLSSANWTTFNGKESVLSFGAPMIRSGNTVNWVGLATTTQPSSSNILVSNGGAGVYGVATSTRTHTGPFTISGTLGFQVGGTNSVVNWTGLATTTNPTGGHLLYSSGGAGVTSAATSSQTFSSAAFSSSGTIGNLVGGTSGTLSSLVSGSFSVSTTTAWTGTTTIPLGPASTAETWNNVKCFTDAGTLQVSFTDGTNRMNWLNGSTTVGTVTLNSNNTFTAGEKRYVDIGTPASTPTYMSCTVNKTI